MTLSNDTEQRNPRAEETLGPKAKVGPDQTKKKKAEPLTVKGDKNEARIHETYGVTGRTNL